MLIKIVFLILLMIGFVEAVHVSLICPTKVIADKEFQCSIKTAGTNATYDVKIELGQKRNSALRVWNGEKKGWASGYYYLKSFIRGNEKKDIKLKMTRVGRYEIILKLRSKKKVRKFNGTFVSVGNLVQKHVVSVSIKARSRKQDLLPKVVALSGDAVSKSKDVRLNNRHSSSSMRKVIFLNAKSEEASPKWDYISKNGEVVDWLPYGFCLFLIFMIVFLMRGDYA